MLFINQKQNVENKTIFNFNIYLIRFYLISGVSVTHAFDVTAKTII